MSKTKPATATRTAGDLVRAGLAGLALLALLAAVPWGLITFIGNPLPNSMPTWSTLNESVGTTVIINTIAVVLWAVWAQFAFCVAVELRAALSKIGRLPMRVPAAGANQALARQLVVTMLLVSAGALTVGTATAAPAAAAPRAAATAAAVPQQTLTAVTAAPAAPEQHLPIYVVKAPSEGHRDSLWRIAEQHLGDGTRWSEIQTLNEGRPQPDGGSLGSNSRIRPGWTLLLPADAVGDDLARPTAATAPQSSEGAGEHLVTVVEGDTLSGIAERELGDGDKYPLLLEATKALVQPDGSHLSNPDELFPGEKIVIPAPATATTTPDQTPAPTAPAEQPAPSTTATATPAPTKQPPTSAESPTAAPAADPAQTAATTQPTQHPTAEPEHAQTAPADSNDSVRNLAAGGAILAAGVLASIGFRRRLQQRRRKPTRRIPMPAGQSAGLERQLRATTNPTGLALLDRSLRSMAAHAAHLGQEVPQLEAVRVSGDAVELYLAAPATPIAPFTATEEGTTLWRCGSSTRNTALLSAEEAARTPAPYPTLVSLGHTPEGDPVLVDLETMGLLSLDGSDGDVLAVLRAFTVELANSKLADDRLLLLAGVGEELAELYPTHADYYETLPKALATLASQDAFQRQALEAGGHPSLRAARVSDPATGDAWTPHILISTDEPAAPQAEQLADILGAQPRTSIGVIAGNRTDLPVETSWRIPAEAGLEIEIDSLPFTVILQRIEPDAYQHLVDVLATAERRDTLPAPAWTRPDTTTATAERTEEDADQDAEMSEEPVPVEAVAASGSALAAQATYAAGSPALALGPSTIPGTVTMPVAPAKNTAAAAGAAGSSREPQDLDLIAEEDDQEQRARAAAAISAAGPDEVDREENADPEEDVFGLVDNEEDEDEDPDWGEDEEDLDAVIARYAQNADDEQGEEQEEEQHEVRGTEQDGEQQTAEEEAEDDAVAGAAARPVTVPSLAPAAVPAGANARVSHRLHNSSAVLAALTAEAKEPSVPYVRLLGRVEVLGLRDGKQDSRRRQLTEVAAWLVLNPGSSRLEFDEAMWPGTRVDNQGRNTLMSRARRWLGDKPDGSPYLPRITEDVYGLDPAVTCDWAQFQELYRAGHHGSGLDADIALAQALALVRGRPFAGTLATKYTWNEAWVQEMISAIEDAAHELAQRRLAERDYRAAAMAAARGLEAVPESELLYRDLFEVHAASGDRESLERAARRLHDLNEELGVDPEEETVDLLETLLKGRRTATA
ncbi:hypothetical protein KNE206_76710 [Kitasatospora sp. NE20-6]|uniref:LysM peptidoglycan-binding domain-containing protein n=1 Tax=Kitasatospora sp. NE20-6 TaxID=2859066 RepID=UPI0034DBFFDF